MLFTGKPPRLLAVLGTAVLVTMLGTLLLTSSGTAPLFSRYTPSAERMVVVVGRTDDDTEWLNQLQVPYTLYVADAPFHQNSPHVPRGNEAASYLSYIVDNYDTLPEVIAFVHWHQNAWHHDQFDGDLLQMLNNVQWDRVRDRFGYHSLRCEWVPGCIVEIDTSHINTGRQPEEAYPGAWRNHFAKWLGPMPDVVGAPCCAQFVVSAKVLRQRPRAFYTDTLKWLAESELSSEVSGRVMEYTWHIIAGMPHVYCPTVEECRCQLYNLDCPRKDQSGD